MHQNLLDVFARLDDSHRRLIAAVDAVPVAQRATRPAADRWSVAEILEHLALVETRLGGSLAREIDRALESGLAAEEGDRVPLPPPIEQRMADRVNKRSAPETAIPTGTLDAMAALAAAEAARTLLRNAAQRGDGRALSGVTYSHHVFGALNVYQWLELMSGHERRHAEQIDELRLALSGGGSGE